jgi:hypothetical protein
MRWQTAAKTAAKSECRWFAPAEANGGNKREQQDETVVQGSAADIALRCDRHHSRGFNVP